MTFTEVAIDLAARMDFGADVEGGLVTQVKKALATGKKAPFGEWFYSPRVDKILYLASRDPRLDSNINKKALLEEE